MTVRETTHSDFEKIYELLKRLNDTSFDRAVWEKIASVNFQTERDHYGFVLESDTEILGFLGTIFSERQFNGKVYKFCNIHSWIVDPKAKTGGMALLLKVLGLKDYIITNFTASEAPYKIFKSLKFNEVEYKNRKLFPFQSYKNSLKVEVKKINEQNASTCLKENELRLYDDHRQFDNVHFLNLKIGEKNSFVISKKKKYSPQFLKKTPLLQNLFQDQLQLAEIHYISNPELFFLAFSSTTTAYKICRGLGAMGIIVADRYIPSPNTLNIKHYPSKRPYFYRHTNDETLIDTLYSEFFILNF